MLINITVTGENAKALSYILWKNPEHIFDREFSSGHVVVFFSEYSDQKATASMLVLVDTVGMVRSEWGKMSSSYVDHRPYAASSITSVALKEAYSSAFAGKSETAEIDAIIKQKLPVEIELSSVWTKGGVQNVHDFFEPINYAVKAEKLPYESKWLKSDSNVFNITLTGMQTIPDLLRHLYVLLPALDNKKHYFVDGNEIAKLLSHGEGWLETHPHKERIVSRYLIHRHNLIEEALEQLTEDILDEDTEEGTEEAVERPIRLQEERLQTALAVLRTLDPAPLKLGDLGCGSGDFIRLIENDRAFPEVIGMDVSSKALQLAEKRLHLDRRNAWQMPKISFIHGSLVYKDSRLKGLDAILLLEVIEHIDAAKLPIIEYNIFEFLSPGYVFVSTPNQEYNSLFPSIEKNALRHRDHRFEWTRNEFKQWSDAIAVKYSYEVEFFNIGPCDDNLGAPTQMAVFKKK